MKNIGKKIIGTVAATMLFCGVLSVPSFADNNANDQTVINLTTGNSPQLKIIAPTEINIAGYTNGSTVCPTDLKFKNLSDFDAYIAGTEFNKGQSSEVTLKIVEAINPDNVFKDTNILELQMLLSSGNDDLHKWPLDEEDPVQEWEWFSREGSWIILANDELPFTAEATITPYVEKEFHLTVGTITWKFEFCPD